MAISSKILDNTKRVNPKASKADIYTSRHCS